MTSYIKKAFPIVLRHNNSELLAFEHPFAGNQIVKGSIEVGETPEQACIRELAEESGLIGTPIRNLPSLIMDNGQHYFFSVMGVNTPFKEHWTHYTDDDGGHLFRFFWHPLNNELNKMWHPIFIKAICHIKKFL